VKEVKILIQRTEKMAEVWVDLKYRFSIVGKEAVQPGLYTARSLSQDNTKYVMVSIPISTEEVTETANVRPLPGIVVTQSTYTRLNVLFQQH